MTCGKCIGLPLAKGIKFVKCNQCGVKTSINAIGYEICKSCSDKYNICNMCGEEFRKIEYVEINKQGE